VRFPDASGSKSAFTLVELSVSFAIFSVFSAGLFVTWTALGMSAMNMTTYAQRQNDQMRVFDYLKRDIRRASAVAIYNGGTLVTGTNFGDEIRLTISDYYADTHEEDKASGLSTPSVPTLTNGSVTYGTSLTVRYYVSNGAVIRNEAGTLRTIGDASGAFALSFSAEASGLIRCRVLYNDTLRSGNDRTLRRQEDILCGQRAQFYK